MLFLSKRPGIKVLSFFLVLTFFSPCSFTPTPNQNTLSPITVVKPGFTETDRSILMRTIVERADAARGTTDINIFQGYDVRGIALDHGEDKANLRPEDAFLISEAIVFLLKNPHKMWSKAEWDEMRKDLPEGAHLAATLAMPNIRVLVTGDHRETSQALISAAVRGASLQGAKVEYDSGQVPTGALNFYGLRENYDVIIQVTGSHNPFHHNGLKIAVKQKPDGRLDLNGKLGALYGNQGKRRFELKDISEAIVIHENEIKGNRVKQVLEKDIHGEGLGVTGSYLEKEPNRPNFGRVVQEYVNAFKERFGKLKNPRRLVVDPGNGMGAAAIPVLEHQGNKIERGLYLDVQSRPVHPADPSKDTSGTAPLEKSGCRACIEAIKEINESVSEGELPAIGVLTDGDGDRSGLIDEDGNAIRPAPIAILIYRRFILENLPVLEILEKMGRPITLALDVRSSNVLESITGVVTPTGEILKKGLYAGVQGIYIPAGYPSHRDHVAKEIAKLNQLIQEINQTDKWDSYFRLEAGKRLLTTSLTNLIQSFVSAEASGHYFAATDSTHPDIMIDDGIFYAARVLKILDTWNEFEGKDENIKLTKKDVYLLKDIFSPESIPSLPSPDEPRYKGHQSIDDRYAFVAARQKDLIEKGEKIFRGKIGSLVTMDQVTDGVRILFEDGSAFLIRTSNTSAKYTSMIEGPTWFRVVEILEDAIAWLTPFEGPEFSIDDLRDRLKDAKAKALFENTGVSTHSKFISAKASKLADFQTSLKEAVKDEDRMMGWLHADEQDLTEIKRAANDIRENFEDVIVIGIGGSSMGLKALHQALNADTEFDPYNQRPEETRGRDGKKAPRLHILESTRPEALRVIDRLDLKKTAVIVISKSGGTPEPKFNTEVVLSKFEKAGITGDQLASQFVLITGLDQEKGELPSSKLRQRFGKMGDDGYWVDTAREIFPVPNSFGGRYSVFSPVGLLPAAVVGIDVDGLIDGVRQARKKTELPFSDPENIGFQLGLHLDLLNKNNIYFYYFNKALLGLGRWMEQLVQESLGDFIELDKPKVYSGGLAMISDPEPKLERTGPNVKPTMGTEDNHSFVQDLQDGKRDKVVLFVNDAVSEETIEQERRDGLYDAQGLTPSQFLKASLIGTRSSLTEKRVPNITFTLNGLNEIELAKLMYTMEVMTMVYGYLLGLGHKTFTQGGVEGYKVGTRKAIEEMVARGEVKLPDISI